MSDNDFPAPPKLKPKTLNQICQDYPRELWWTDGEDGEVKQAPEWVLNEVVDNLSHTDSPESPDFMFNVLQIGGDWGDFCEVLKAEISNNPQSELAKYYSKTSKDYAQYLIERAEDTDFMVSTAYKAAQADAYGDDLDVVALDDYRNRRGE